MPLWGKVSPAHAGIDLSANAPMSIGSRFPRTRGDRPLKATLTAWGGEFPPHTRG